MGVCASAFMGYNYEKDQENTRMGQSIVHEQTINYAEVIQSYEAMQLEASKNREALKADAQAKMRKGQFTKLDRTRYKRQVRMIARRIAMCDNVINMATNASETSFSLDAQLVRTGCLCWQRHVCR